MWNKKTNGAGCEAYEARFEDFLEGADAGGELRAHLERCAGCREGLEAARFSRELLRESMAPALGPGGAFATRVMAQIRSQERETRRGDLWGALEVLASRLALTAAMALVLLGVYAGVSGMPRDDAAASTEASLQYPSVVSQPSNSDEVLQAFVGGSHAR